MILEEKNFYMQRVVLTLHIFICYVPSSTLRWDRTVEAFHSLAQSFNAISLLICHDSFFTKHFNPLNTEIIRICHFLALLGGSP